MPTYDYKCTKCKHSFEEFQSISSEPYAPCPKCSQSVRRLISSGSGIIFKGSGFYVTDYKNKESRNANKSAASSGSGNSAKSGSDSANKSVSAS